MTAAEKLYLDIIEKEEGAISSQMFGKPCGKINGKAYVSFFKEAMAFKIGREAAKSLLPQIVGSELFDPSQKNRPFRDWIHIPYTHAKDWSKYAKMAVSFTIN